MKKGDYKSIVAKMENIWTKIFLQKIDQESCGWNSICQILIPPHCVSYYNYPKYCKK